MFFNKVSDSSPLPRIIELMLSSYRRTSSWSFSIAARENLGTGISFKISAVLSRPPSLIATKALATGEFKIAELLLHRTGWIWARLHERSYGKLSPRDLRTPQRSSDREIP